MMKTTISSLAAVLLIGAAVIPAQADTLYVFTNSLVADQGAANISGGNAAGDFATITNQGGTTVVIISNSAPLAFTNANNSYTGDTIIEQGTLVAMVNAPNAANGAFGNSATAIQVGSTNAANSNAATLLIGAAGVEVGRAITINAGGTGTRTVGATNATGTAAYSGNIAMNADVTLSASNAGGTTLFSGALSGTHTLTKTGAGTVTLSGSNSYTGGTLVEGGTLAISGPGGAVSATAALEVDNASAFIISNGGRLAATYGSILGSGFTSSNNTALVTGAGSAWTSARDVSIGYLGERNTLTISNGGMLADDWGLVGNGTSSYGNTALVTGAGSLWTNSTNFFVGGNGSGNTLTISDGGRVASTVSSIGYGSPSSNNTALVTGAGSLWTNSGTFYVGESGSGNSLTITNGGAVNVGGDLTISVFAGAGASNNALNIGGGQLTVTNGTLFVDQAGGGGSGALNISGGTVLVKQLTTVHSNGVITFNGGTINSRGTTIINGLDFVIGNTGGGAAFIADGGTHSFQTNLIIGNSSPSNSMTITNGGAAVVAGDANLGQQAGADGNSLAVGGGVAASSLTVGQVINVGFGGAGNTLGILSNGTVNATSVRIGGYGANNTLALNGGTLNATNDLVVGYFTAGNALDVTAGGSATAGSITVGLDAAASNNTVLVSGTGSVLQTAGLVYLGESGSSNSLAIEGGGKVLSQASDAVIGFAAGANGNTLSISGTGSIFSNNATFYVGRTGAGNSLTVQSNASLVTKNSRIGGDAASSNNVVTVSGAGSVWTNTGSMRVGSSGSGNSLVVSNGGTVEVRGNTFVGYLGTTSSNNSVIVSGAGSQLVVTNVGTEFVVGGNATSNSVTVADGGELVVRKIQFGPQGRLQIGTGGAAGSVSSNAIIGATNGGGTVAFDHGDASYLFGATLTGDLSVQHVGTGTTTLSGANTYSGTTVISNGTLQTANASALGTSAVQLDAGTLAPVGTLDIQSLSWNGGTIASALGTNTSFIGIATNFTLGTNGGTFAFSDDGGFMGNTNYAILGWTNWGSITASNFSGNALFGLNPIFTINGTNLLVNFHGPTSGPVLQNSSDVFTPLDANFFVSNSVTTGKTNEDNTVAALTFEGASTLTVFNTLNVTNGNFTVNSGLATVTNGTLVTPGDFNKLGAGTLALSGAAQVGSNAVIDAGALLVEGMVNAAGNLYVGKTNSNIAMTITNGGAAVVAGDANLGHIVGSDGNTLAVGGGAASSLSVGGVLNVGFGGVGNTLGILSNGTVNAASVRIGGYGASNTANVSGGALNATNDLVVGYFTAGNALNVTNGGNATAGSITVGLDAAASNNTIRVSGTGSVLQTAGLFYLGESGSSNSLAIEGGGKVLTQTSDAAIGLNAGANGNTLSISGTGSMFSNNATFYVGRTGAGNSLTVQSNASLVTKNSRIGGDAASSNNVVTVSGAGSVWTNTGTMRVGSSGSGNTLLISNGGAVEVRGNTFVGYLGTTSSNNSVIVSGAGSRLVVTNAGTEFVVGGNATSNSVTVADGGELVVRKIQFGPQGRLQIGTGGAAGSVSSNAIIGATNGGGTVAFDHGDASYLFGATMTGDLSVQHVGSGTTTLSGANTYSGTTVISNGTLQTANASALGTSAVQLDAGTLAPVGTLDIQSLSWNGGTIASTLGTNTSFVGIATNFTLGTNGGNFAFTGGGFMANTNYAILGWTNWGSITASNFSGNALFGLNPIFTINGTNLLVNFAGASSGSIIQNGGPTYTPTYADFFVSNNVVTAGPTNNNIVNSLTFAPNSSLQVYNRLQVTSGNFTVNSGNATVQGGQLFVPGDFTKLGDGLLNLLGQVLVNGQATVSAGGLLVNGEFTANGLTVLRNALLGGAGTIFGNVLNNGTVSPGNSPGTLTIVGNYTQGSSGNLAMEIAGPNNFDRLVVSGTAALAGTLTVTTVDGGTLSFGDKYQFLSAAGGISGEFDTIAMPAGFRGRFLTDSSNTTGTLLVAPQSYTQVAVTPNQVRVAGALDAFIPATNGDRFTVSLALDELTAPQYPAAFEQIMPSIYASIPTLAFNQANALNTAMFQRMWMQRLNGAGFSSAGMAMEPMQSHLETAAAPDKKTVLPVEPAKKNWGVFADGNGVFATANSGGALQDYRSQGGGITAGASYKWNENFATGVYAGYQGLVAQYDGGSRLTDNAVRFGGFGTVGVGGTYLNGLVGGAYHGYDVSRSIEFGTVNRTARSKPGAGEFDLALAAGHDFKAGRFTFGPVTSMQYTYLGVQGFNETGADSLDLGVGGYSSSSLLYSLGAQAAYRWEITKNFALTPMISANWQHEFLQNAYPINAAFNTGGPSSPFGFQAAQPQQDYFYAGAGLGLDFGGAWEVSFFYNAAAGNQDLTSQNIYLSVGAKF